MNSFSPANRTLAPLAQLLWPLAIAASILMVAAWLSGFGDLIVADPTVETVKSGNEMRRALAVFARSMDAVWVTLAAMVTYLALAQAEGLDTARRWFGLSIVGGFAIGISSVLTRYPLGAIYFPQNLGWRIGPVPFAFPLLCWVVVAGGRELALRLLPRAGHNAIALLVAILTGLTFLNLDPLTSTYRAWWIWPPPVEGSAPHSSVQTHLAWLGIGFILAWVMRSSQVGSRGQRRPWPPALLFLILNATALATHLVFQFR